jgi:sortase A
VKKLLLILLVLFVGAGIYLSQSKNLHPAPIAGISITPTETIKPVKGVQTGAKSASFAPSKLRIPKINITASIEEVGLDAEKRMDVPKDDFDVGWYKYGAIPGEKGSAVLAGHFDTKKGGPAVFYRLSELKPNDQIIIIGENGEERTFVVTDTKIFKDETFPIPLVFSQDGSERLNLITCDGVFDKNQKNYTDRLVVFTKLKTS